MAKSDNLKGWNAFAKGPNDREFLTQYYISITNQRKFQTSLRKGNENRGPLVQHYESELFREWDQYLINTDRAPQAVSKAVGKWSLAGEVFEILDSYEDDDYDFQVIDHKKMVGAILYKGVFYEVKITKHKKDPSEGTPTVGTKLNPYIELLSDKLSEGNTITIVKNNQVSLTTDDFNYLSVKITRKKENLF